MVKKCFFGQKKRISSFGMILFFLLIFSIQIRIFLFQLRLKILQAGISSATITEIHLNLSWGISLTQLSCNNKLLQNSLIGVPTLGLSESSSFISTIGRRCSIPSEASAVIPRPNFFQQCICKQGSTLNSRSLLSLSFGFSFEALRLLQLPSVGRYGI